MRDTGLDPIHVERDVPSVRDRLFVVVFDDKIPLEEAEGLVVWGRGQTNQECIGALNDLPP